MSTVIVAAMLLGFIAIITLLFVQVEKHKKRKHRQRILTQFSVLGTRNDLSFSSQEIIQDNAIGLDGVRRKLLILIGDTETKFTNYVLCLNDIKTCMVKKQYSTSSTMGLKDNKLEPYLEKLILRFEMKNGEDPVEVNFNHITGNIYQIKEREDKARQWEAILSKMLPQPLKERVC